jgi:hypothetical protein
VRNGRCACRSPRHRRSERRSRSSAPGTAPDRPAAADRADQLAGAGAARDDVTAHTTAIPIARLNADITRSVRLLARCAPTLPRTARRAARSAWTALIGEPPRDLGRPAARCSLWCSAAARGSHFRAVVALDRPARNCPEFQRQLSASDITSGRVALGDGRLPTSPGSRRHHDGQVVVGEHTGSAVECPQRRTGCRSCLPTEAPRSSPSARSAVTPVRLAHRPDRTHRLFPVPETRTECATGVPACTSGWGSQVTSA